MLVASNWSASAMSDGIWCDFVVSTTVRWVHRGLEFFWRIKVASPSHRTWVERPYFAIKILGSIPSVLVHCIPTIGDGVYAWVCECETSSYMTINTYLCMNIHGDHIINVNHLRATGLGVSQQTVQLKETCSCHQFEHIARSNYVEWIASTAVQILHHQLRKQHFAMRIQFFFWLSNFDGHLPGKYDIWCRWFVQLACCHRSILS